MLNKKKNNKGFTLVELLVVIAIIGILAVVAVPSLMKNIDKGKAADIVAECNAIRTAAITRYTDTGTLGITTAGELSEYLDNLDTSKYQVVGTAATSSTPGSLKITVVGAAKGRIEELVEKDLGVSATVAPSGNNLEITFVLN